MSATLEDSGTFIDALKRKQFNMNGCDLAGFIAHEFAEVSPTSVSGKGDAVEAVGAAVRAEQVLKGIVIPSNRKLKIKASREPDTIIPEHRIENIFKGDTPDGYTWTKTADRSVCQAMQASSSEVMAHIILELQDLRRRVKELETA